MRLKITTNINDFNLNVQQFISNYENRDVSKALKEIAFALLQRIIPRTPVDTGRARGGWHVAGRKLGIPVPPGGEGDLIEKTTGIKQYIEIVNRVEYITYLEYGWSQQAPRGMARISINEMAKLLRTHYGRP